MDHCVAVLPVCLLGWLATQLCKVKQAVVSHTQTSFYTIHFTSFEQHGRTGTEVWRKRLKGMSRKNRGRQKHQERVIRFVFLILARPRQMKVSVFCQSLTDVRCIMYMFIKVKYLLACHKGVNEKA